MNLLFSDLCTKQLLRYNVNIFNIINYFISEILVVHEGFMNYDLSDMIVNFASIGRHIGIVFMHQTGFPIYSNIFKKLMMLPQNMPNDPSLSASLLSPAFSFELQEAPCTSAFKISD